MATLTFDAFWRDHGAKAGLRGLSKEAKEAAKEQAAFKREAVLAGAVVAAALWKMGKTAVEVASDTAESQSKVGVVFGQSAAEVVKFSQTSARSMGISKAAYLDAAGTLGNLFVALKLPQPEAEKMSTKMVQLAADLASFNNADPSQVLEDLRSGLVGETEPLRKYGVNLNDATLQQKALELGLVSTTKGTLPAAAKAQAAYALILEQTKTAQGDFARTSSGLANSQRILAAEFSDLEGQLGQKLLPVAIDATHALMGMVTFIEDHGRSVSILAGGIAAVVGSVVAVNKASEAFKKTAQAWDTVTSAVKSFTDEGGKARKAAGSFGSFMAGPWGVALLAGAGLLALWAKKQADARQRVDDLKQSLDEQTGAITENTRKVAFQALQSDGAVKAAKDLGISLKDVTDAAVGNAEAQARVNAEIERQRSLLAGAPNDVVNAQWQTELDKLQHSLVGSNSELAKARGELKDQQAAQVTATGSTQDLTAATQNNTAALAKNVDKLTEREGLLGKRDAERNYQQAIDDLTQSVKDNGKTLDNNTEKGRNNNEALDRLAGAAHDYKVAIEKAGGSTAAANAIQADAYKRLVTAARGLGMSRDAADKYARAILGIPATKNTKVTVDMGASIDKVFGLKTLLNGLRSKDLFVNVRIKNQGALADLKAQGYAGGGAVGHGVGTRDTELAALTVGEHVLTTTDVRNAGGHAGVMRWRRAIAGYAAGGPVGGRSVFPGARGGGAVVQNVYLSAPNYVGSRTELLGALTDLARSGRLDKILKQRV